MSGRCVSVGALRRRSSVLCLPSSRSARGRRRRSPPVVLRFLTRLHRYLPFQGGRFWPLFYVISTPNGHSASFWGPGGGRRMSSHILGDREPSSNFLPCQLVCPSSSVLSVWERVVGFPCLLLWCARHTPPVVHSPPPVHRKEKQFHPKCLKSKLVDVGCMLMFQLQHGVHPLTVFEHRFYSSMMQVTHSSR